MSSSLRIVEVFDPEFKHVIEVPAAAISHYPPQRLNITRLVVCRNHVANSPHSCAMGSNCKFVHIDANIDELPSQPIHINYAWRTPELVTYARLPPGEVLSVMAPNNRPPTEEIRSELVLVTRGSLMRKEHAGSLSHCAHYYFNRMCNRGERCNFIHAVHVDPTVQGNFKRAPTRSTVQRQQLHHGPGPKKLASDESDHHQHHRQQSNAASDETSPHDGSCGHVSAAESEDAAAAIAPYRKEDGLATTTGVAPRAVRLYRHNPYSFEQVTVWC